MDDKIHIINLEPNKAAFSGTGTSLFIKEHKRDKNKNETKTQTRTQQDANKKTNNRTRTKHEPRQITKKKKG